MRVNISYRIVSYRELENTVISDHVTEVDCLIKVLSTGKFSLLSRLTSRQSSELRCCLLEGSGTEPDDWTGYSGHDITELSRAPILLKTLAYKPLTYLLTYLEDTVIVVENSGLVSLIQMH